MAKSSNADFSAGASSVSGPKTIRPWTPRSTRSATCRCRRTSNATTAWTIATGTRPSSRARDGRVVAGHGTTDLFIYPGFDFRVVDGLLTNFHLPRSSLLMLVSAFAGGDRVRTAYDAAVAERYRFYSYGDAMVIL